MSKALTAKEHIFFLFKNYVETFPKNEHKAFILMDSMSEGTYLVFDGIREEKSIFFGKHLNYVEMGYLLDSEIRKRHMK